MLIVYAYRVCLFVSHRSDIDKIPIIEHNIYDITGIINRAFFGICTNNFADVYSRLIIGR